MTPRAAARAIIAAGWLAGMSLILAGLPFPAAAATLATAVVAAIAWIRWGARLRAWLTGTWTGLRLWQKLRKAGSALERA
jgi:hypothetical protein